MKRHVLSRCLVLLLSLCCSFCTASDNETEESLLNTAMNAWHSGDMQTTESHLTSIIESGSADPRALYFRGILAEQMGKSGDADFKAAAKLEANRSRSAAVSRALEKVQGPLRARIEKCRSEARAALKSDPGVARLMIIYREALDARKQGNLPAALVKLDEVTSTGSDPRYFYMYGVALAESGDTEKAQLAFAEGLRHEKSPADTQRVSQILTDVQGDIRQMIEATTIEVEGQVVTRQENSREVMRRALMTQEQLLAESNAATEAVAVKERLELEARRIAVAEAIRAENQARLEQEVNTTETPAAEENASGFDDPSAKSEMLDAETAPDDAEMAEEAAAEEAPAVADTGLEDADSAGSAAVDNPFLGGTAVAPTPGFSAATSSVTPGPIDMSWLPAKTEYLMYLRPADLLSSGFVKPLTDMPQFEEAVAEMSGKAGFAATDIDSVTMGMGNVVANMIPMFTQLASGPQNPEALTNALMGREDFMVVVRLNKDVDFSKMIETAESTEMSHEGTTYYLLKNEKPEQPQMALQSVDSRTFLVSSEPGIQAAISNGPGESLNEQFSFVSRSSHMIQAFSSPLLAGMSAGIPEPEGAPQPVADFVAAIKGAVSGGALVLESGSDLTVNITLNLTASSSAEDANKALAELLNLAKQFAPLGMGQVPPLLQPSLLQAVNTLASSSADSQVTATVRIPGGLVKVLKDHPEMLQPPQGGPAVPGNFQ